MNKSASGTSRHSLGKICLDKQYITPVVVNIMSKNNCEVKYKM